MSRSPRRHRPARDPLRALVVIVCGLALVTGCQAQASPVPTGTGALATPLLTPGPETASPPAAAGGRWDPAGSLALQRLDARAARLGDSSVLVVGNETYREGPDATTTAEVWDPATGSWAPAAALGKFRGYFAVAELADGRVLVTGGLNGDEPRQSYSSAYVYDGRPGHEDWTKVGLMGSARTAPAIAVLADGRVLVAGGYFYTGVQEETGAIEGPGLVEGLAAVPGAILAAARFVAPRPSESPRPPLDDVDMPPHGYALATAEMFDPATGTWSPSGSMVFARAGASAVTLADGRVLIVGSTDLTVTEVDRRAYETAEIYDPDTGRFTLTGQLPGIDRDAIEDLGVSLPESDPEPATNGRLVALADGGAVLIAKTVWWKHEGELSRSFRYDGTTGQWGEIGQPCAWRVNHATGELAQTPGVCRVDAQAATLPDGRVLVAGGQEAYQNVSLGSTSAELYDPTTNTWLPQSPMPEARAGGADVVLADGSVLIIGGIGGYKDDALDILTSAVRFIP